jgi:hypothetical protein
VDPNSGTAALLEIGRALGEMMRTGWRPRRSIVLASWDAEEACLGVCGWVCGWVGGWVWVGVGGWWFVEVRGEAIDRTVGVSVSVSVSVSVYLLDLCVSRLGVGAKISEQQPS